MGMGTTVVVGMAMAATAVAVVTEAVVTAVIAMVMEDAVAES